MTDVVEIAFHEHFYRTSQHPSDYEYLATEEGDRDWERSGEPVTDVISSAAEIDYDPAEDIRIVLEERHSDIERDRMGLEGQFDLDAHYAENDPDDAELQIEWRYFEETLKTEARYFSRSAAATLASFFEGIESHATRGGSPLFSLQDQEWISPPSFARVSSNRALNSNRP